MGTNIKQFEKSLRQAKAVKVDGTFLAFQRNVALAVYDAVAVAIRDVSEQKEFGSPKLTGRFVGSHNIAINRVDTSVLPPAPNDERDFYTRKPPELIEAILKPLKLGDTINISNAVPYATDLEGGTSRKTPRGIYRVTARFVAALLSTQKPRFLPKQ